ncbi:SARP family transcriptional regulator [Catellatospora methionotrophica]|uniref:SARP family transcriptional regulator n=1 Tax=Catellatospora methionotrophica TaxID=121620 RepID=A0A8J3L533_9ACTN|nr:BTAD domain-containing putative transcriptional regulator [Catellatospora methionotrophica]GIG12515.1 SARP family transcriptional regulator [Catellatospora methionotrophica]
MRFRVLGPVEVNDGTAWLSAGPAKARALLAALLVDADRIVGVDQLSDRLWGQSPPRTAANQIHGYVARLRRALADADGRVLMTRPPGYRLAVAPADLDADLFTAGAAAGTAALRSGDPASASTLLTQALAHWRGRAYADVPPAAAVAAEAGRLEEERLAALEARIDADLLCHRHPQLIGELTLLVEEHPFREQLWHHQMLALYRCGRQADALNAYQRLRTLLDEELGVVPSAPLRELHQRILSTDPALDAPSPPAVALGAAPHHPTIVPRQLPAACGAFVGRSGQLRELDLLAGRPGALAVISGTAGVGKTSLAVHWAHRNADRYPDGQLYVNLHGHDPARAATSPVSALHGLLEALLPAGERIPFEEQAKAALYRSLTVDRRLLVVLDNARDAEQVRPLLPAAPGCLVIVTSRDQMQGLVAGEAAHSLTLDVFSAADAHRLLVHRLGRDRIDAEQTAVDTLIARCAGLPLALAVVVAHAATYPSFSLAELAAELDGDARLNALDRGDLATDVRAAFACSMRTLSEGAGELFRRLSLHPGPDISLAAAAAIADAPPAAARTLLDELTRAHLIEQHAPSRFTFHDLLRVYARELLHEHDTPAVRRAATTRYLDHYLDTALLGVRLLAPRRPCPLRRAPGRPEDLADAARAQAWFVVEHTVLMAVQQAAAVDGADTHTWQLAWALATFQDRQGFWHDWMAAQQLGVAAAEHGGDPAARAHSRRGLGRALATVGRHDDAIGCLEQALALLHDEPAQEGQIHLDIALALETAGRSAEALARAEQSVPLFERAGGGHALGIALNCTGWYHALAGHYDSCVEYCLRALALLHDTDDRRGRAATHDSLGYAYQRLGSSGLAADHLRRAVALFQETGDRHGTADALDHLGECLAAAGDQAQAEHAWQQSLAIFEFLDHPGAVEIRGKLLALAR